MAEMLLLNPRRRPAKRRPAAKRRVVRRNPIALAAAPRRRRRLLTAARRHNPIGIKRFAGRARRRISAGARTGGRAIAAQIQNALIGGAGAVAMDVLMGQINGFLPASMQRVPGKVGVGDAVKFAITIAAGNALNKPTRGLSSKLAAGALVCQSRDILASFVPASMKLGGLGYMTPARIVTGAHRLGPNQSRVAAYQRPGGTPLLAAYTRPGVVRSLRGMPENIAASEGFPHR